MRDTATTHRLRSAAARERPNGRGATPWRRRALCIAMILALGGAGQGTAAAAEELDKPQRHFRVERPDLGGN